MAPPPRGIVQWQIALPPGEYIFEDYGNALTIIAQREHHNAILLSFPVGLSRAWLDQGISQNNLPRPLTLLDHLTPCYLPCFVSRGPRVSGFLHPACYGIPGANDTTKGSCQAVYVPTTVFEGDGLLVTSSYAAAYYQGRAASYLAWGGISNPVRAFPSQAAAQAFFRHTAPQTVTLPAVVPYLGQQLEFLDLLVESNNGPIPTEPI
jgi:hypothetical protein